MHFLVAGALVVGVYVGLALVADAPAVLGALGRVPLAVVVLSLGLVVALFAVRSLRWRLYLGRIGAVPPAGPIAFAPAFAMGLAQGKWGQVVKAWALRRDAGTPYSVAVPAIVAERVSDVVGGLLHLLVGLAIAPAVDARLFVGALAGSILLFLAMRSAAAARVLVRALAFVPAVRRHADALLVGHRRLREHMTLRELAAPATMALAAFLLESLVLYALAAHGLGLDVGIGEAVLILAIVDVAATLSFLPAGIGAAEGGLVALLALDGVGLADAAAVTLLFRVTTLWFGMGLGVLGVAFLWRMRPTRLSATAQVAGR